MNMNPIIYSLGRPHRDALHRYHPDAMISKQGWLARASPGSDALHRCHPGVMTSKQGCSKEPQYSSRLINNIRYSTGQPKRERSRRLLQENRIRLATWNIGTLTGKTMELVEVMLRRKINIICLQETKWVGEKSREIEKTGFKLWYSGKEKNRNGVGVLVDNIIKESVVEVKRIGDRILLIKVVLGVEVINIISTYAPQIGLSDHTKGEFWDRLDELVQTIPFGEKLFIGGDLNGHIGKDNNGYERIHGGFGYGDKNEMGESILEFATSYDLIIANTLFRKRDEHLITFKSGCNNSQIDFFLTRGADRLICKDCKVIPGESLSTQHRLMVLDISIKKWSRKTNVNKRLRTKWWNLKGDNLIHFKDKIIKEDIWSIDNETNTMWNSMSSCIKKVAKDVLGESKGCRLDGKESWWWNESVQKVIKEKKILYKEWQKCRSRENLEKYKLVRKEAKRAVSENKYKAYENFYKKLESKEGEKDIYKLAKVRERKSRDLGNIRCIKSEDQRVLVTNGKIKERWRSYFHQLFNDNQISEQNKNFNHIVNDRNYRYCRKIRISEVKDALKKMKSGRAVGPDGIPIEVWKCLGDIGLRWLAKLFNKIIETKRMPDEWRISTLIPIYKNKGDIQSCSNYRGIKLMSHTMKLWERVIEQRLRKETSVSENQFGFMPGRSTMEPIHILRRLMERYREKRKDLHMVFIDLEKAYDRVPREVMWWVLEKKHVSSIYIDMIKDMYDRVTTRVKTTEGETKPFPVTTGLHQGSALSPYLFTLVMDQLTRHIQDKIPYCMLFTDDIVLVDETRRGIISKVERWRQALESKGFRISRTKTEYMECIFSKNRKEREPIVHIDGQEIPKTNYFRYLGSIIRNDGEIENDIVHRIKSGWLKWRSASGVLCDRRIPMKLKGKFYRTAIRPAMLYGSECWAIKKQHVQKMSVAEMRMLRWSCGYTLRDRIRNESIRTKLEVAPIEDKMRENRLRWFGHVQRRPFSAPVRRIDEIIVDGARRFRGRPKMTWLEVIKKDMIRLI